jgi:hypothetical protein
MPFIAGRHDSTPVGEGQRVYAVVYLGADLGRDAAIQLVR